MAFHRHRFVCVVSSNVFENLFLSQRLSFLRETGEPESGSASVEVVGDAKIVFANLTHHVVGIFLLLFLLSWFGEEIVVVEVVQIKSLVLSWLSLLVTVNHLHILAIKVVDIHYHMLVRLFLLRIGRLNPSVFDIFFKLAFIFLLEPLEVGNSFFAWNSPSDQKLFVLGQVLVDQFLVRSLPANLQLFQNN
jgi:hypothetical protein